jgi:thiol-disulfide isomerase/thioredoxin
VSTPRALELSALSAVMGALRFSAAVALAGCSGAPANAPATVWTMPTTPGAAASSGGRAVAARRSMPVLREGAGDGVFDLFPPLGPDGEPLYSDSRGGALPAAGGESPGVRASPSAGAGGATERGVPDEPELDEERGLGLLDGRHAAVGPRWWTDEIAALLAADRLGRPLVLDFWASWCPGCHVLDAQTLSDPTVRATLDAWFVPVKLDVSEDGALSKARLTMHRVYALPAVLVLDAQGRELDRLSTVLPPEAFVAWLEAARAKMPSRSEGQRSAGR